jgi:cytidylate kinase
VRDFLLEVQRKAALDQDVVVEGRDTTTVVFPSAWKKFYLDASISERTRRRFEQMKESGLRVTGKDAQKDVVERDKRDQERAIAPLTKAKDAIIIDTTDKSCEQVLDKILSYIRSDS